MKIRHYIIIMIWLCNFYEKTSAQSDIFYNYYLLTAEEFLVNELDIKGQEIKRNWLKENGVTSCECYSTLFTKQLQEKKLIKSYKFNKHGYTVEKFFLTSLSGTEKNAKWGNKLLYSYDDNMKILKHEDFEQRKEKLFNTGEYTYSSIDRTSTYIRKFFTGGLLEKYSLKFDSLGRLDEKIYCLKAIKGKKNFMKKECTTEKYYYDTKGNLIKTTLSGGAIAIPGTLLFGGVATSKIRSQTIYNYNESNNLIESKNMTSSGYVLSRTTYKYDNLGRIVSEMEFDDTKLNSYSKITYNDHGLISEKQIFRQNILSEVLKYEYNGGNMYTKISKYDSMKNPIEYIDFVYK